MKLITKKLLLLSLVAATILTINAPSPAQAGCNIYSGHIVYQPHHYHPTMYHYHG